MTQPSAVRTDQAPAPLQGAPYSQAIVAGELVFVSGQVPLDPSTGKLVEGDVTAQTRQVFANLGAILQAAGSSLSRVVKTTVFLTDLDDFAAMNDTYATFVGDPPPARATIEVSKLPAGAAVEIECIALKE
jgi:2-iminobutanoate/2-iminopropanoate deaminase